MIDRALLQDSIKSAFAHITQPQTDEVVRGQSLEASMVKHYFASRRWNELDSSALAAYDSRADLSAVLSFLTPHAVAYYMPSILLFMIERPKSPGILLDALCLKMKRGQDGFTPTRYTSEQQQAISDMLDYLAHFHQSDDDTRQAIAEAREAWTGSHGGQ